MGSNCRIVHDKFHVMQHANQAIDEVRRAEFFPQGRIDARIGEREQTLAAAQRWMNCLLAWHG